MTEAVAMRTGEPLIDWCRREGSWPEEKMIYAGALKAQVLFFRDVIPRFFSTGEQRAQTRIIGTHRSKSIDCPVYLIEGFGVRVVARDNFHDWNLSVVSERPVGAWADDPWFNDGTGYLFFQGMKPDYAFEPLATSDRKRFSIYLPDQYEVYRFVALLAAEAKAAQAAPTAGG